MMAVECVGHYTHKENQKIINFCYKNNKNENSNTNRIM